MVQKLGISIVNSLLLMGGICDTKKGNDMKTLKNVGLIVLTLVVYGAIALMMALYFLSPTISGERML